MGPGEWQEIKSAFQQALELPVADRPVYLASLSDRVRREVESLLAAHTRDISFPDTSASGAPAGASQTEPDLAGRCFGPYRILSQLGEGGMGTVWLAERVDGLFARRVALKLVHPALMGRTMSERVTREREILASLNHANIAKLFDAGFAEDGQPYLALEYVEGSPLTTYCDDHLLRARERLELFRQVLGAVQYAHSHLVVHRDLKPSNILVSEDGQVHLLDFGIAKLLSSSAAQATQLTQFAGRALTPDYAAPEQITGAPTSTAADVYALGVILYELLSGDRPYRPKRESRGALEEAILQTEPVALSRLPFTQGAAQSRGTSTQKLARTLRGDLERIVGKALEKSPGERYATVNAFDEDVARFLSGRAVLAQPDSVGYRVRKFARRHRFGVAASAALLLTLAAGLVATAYEAHVAAAQRDMALQAQQRSLTQAAAGRLRENDAAGALSIILPVLAAQAKSRPYGADALSVFQEARAADAQVLALSGHTDIVSSAAYSPDGQRVLTASYDKTARLWDAATGQQLIVLSGHSNTVRGAAFSRDGLRIVTASFDKTARLWDATTGRQLSVMSGHTGRVRSAALSPDGRLVVTASEDGTARLWDAASGEQQRVLPGHSAYLRSAVFSPDGRRVLTASDDSTARLWETTTGRELLTLRGHLGPVDTAEFSPDGLRIITGSEDRTARIWDAVSGQQLLVLSGHDFYVDGASFSPDGRHVVTGSGDKTVRLWDATSGEQLRLLSGHTGVVVSATFAPDGRHVASASMDGTVRLWDAVNVRQLRVLNGHPGPVVSAAFARDGKRIVTAGDSTAHLWDANDGRELKVLTHPAYVDYAQLSPDGSQVVTASGDTMARIWDATSGELLRTLTGHTDRVLDAKFAPDGRRVLTTSVDKSARLWDAATGRQLLTMSGHTADVNGAAFSPDGARILTASADRTARLWDASNGRLLLVLAGDTGGVLHHCGYSPDGRFIVTASDDHAARLWDAASGQLLRVLSGHADHVLSAEFSPDSLRIVTASPDKTARVWDTSSGELLLVLSGHTNRVIDAAFSPDGQSVVTASLDKTARVWDARTAPLDVQLAWAEAAQFESLSGAQRFQLGLPDPSDVRRWPAAATRCDVAAAAPYDPARRAAGVPSERIVAEVAMATCVGELGPGDPRAAYQHGRGLVAGNKLSAAREDFERAIAAGYNAARIDLARLLARSPSRVDAAGAVGLYERAFAEGVTIAAFELGDLYERAQTVARDDSRAWAWYQKGADAGEPHSLARFALREDQAALSAGPADRDAHLLRAFRFYAAAAERARREDWPDDAWRSWRYRRASLARLLEHAGGMQQVADAYREVRGQ